jgi:hypothetical protein
MIQLAMLYHGTHGNEEKNNFLGLGPQFLKKLVYVKVYF